MSKILEDIPLNKLPEWINNELFRDCLQPEYPLIVIKVKIISVKPAVAAGENFVSNIYRVKVEVNDGKTQKYFGFILKCIISSAEESLKELNVFAKEVLIYEKLIPEFENLYKEIGENVNFGPKLYKTLLSPDKIFIFEDLNLRNYEVMNRHNGLDLDHCKIFFEKISKFHAASAVYSEKFGYFSKDVFVPIYNERSSMMRNYLNGIYPYFLETIKENDNLKHLADLVVCINVKLI